MKEVSEVNSDFRTVLLHDFLVSRGIAKAEGQDIAEKKAEVGEAIDDFEIKSEEFCDTKAKVTTNLGRISYLRAYINEASVEELGRIIDERGWIQKHKKHLDRLAVDSFKRYANLLKEIKRAAEKSEITSDRKPSNLDDTIFELIEQGRVPPSYGGQLRLLLGMVSAPPGVSIEVVRTAKGQALGRLDGDLLRFKGERQISKREVMRGIGYLERLVAGVNFDSIIQGQNPARNSDKMKRNIESTVAQALKSLYESEI